LLTFILALTVAFVLGFFAFRWFERAVTFHPVRCLPGEVWKLPAGGEEVWLTTMSGERLHGWFLPSRLGSSGTVLYFHGNGGNLSEIAWIGQRLAARDLNVMIFDYRGYGRSEGRAGDERHLNADGDAAYDYLVRRRGINPEKLALYGHSLGTTVAVDIASRKPCGALILESGFSSLSDMAHVVLPWLPRWLHRLSRNHFESARKMANVRCPVLITHGDRDEVIPVSQAHKLYALAPEPKRLLIVPGAAHNVTWFGGNAYLDQIAAFIHQTLAPAHDNSVCEEEAITLGANY